MSKPLQVDSRGFYAVMVSGSLYPNWKTDKHDAGQKTLFIMFFSQVVTLKTNIGIKWKTNALLILDAPDLVLISKMDMPLK